MKALPLSSTTTTTIATKRQGKQMTAAVTGAQIDRLRVFVAKQALETYIRFDGKMELTRGGAATAVEIASDITGKRYKRSMAGKREALADLEEILAMS